MTARTATSPWSPALRPGSTCARCGTVTAYDETRVVGTLHLHSWQTCDCKTRGKQLLGLWKSGPAFPAALLPAVSLSTLTEQRAYFQAWNRRANRAEAVNATGAEHVVSGGAVMEMPSISGAIPGVDVNWVWWTDTLNLLGTLPNDYVDCVVTSPPYFGLRDYGVAGQIGLEPTPAEFVATMVAVFREVRRVLKPSGTVWLNLGDSYSNAGKWGGSKGYDNKQSTNSGSIRRTARNAKDIGAKEKDLLMIPARVAIALQDDGWYLRSEIVWHKPNVMPESVTDRPTKAHEMVYLLTKCPDYWYDQEAIREPHKVESLGRYEYGLNTRAPADGFVNAGANNPRAIGHAKQLKDNINMAGRNKRDVWTVNSEPTPFAHFATFPRKLIEPMILAGCPDKACGKCGKPWRRCVEASGGTIGKSWHDHKADLERGMTQGKHSGGVGNARDASGKPYTRQTVGFEPTCNCNADTHPGLVLDPFFGSGTTGLVARANGRRFIGCDLNPEYVKLARERLRLPFEPHHMTHDSEVADLPLFTAFAAP